MKRKLEKISIQQKLGRSVIAVVLCASMLPAAGLAHINSAHAAQVSVSEGEGVNTSQITASNILVKPVLLGSETDGVYVSILGTDDNCYLYFEPVNSSNGTIDLTNWNNNYNSMQQSQYWSKVKSVKSAGKITCENDISNLFYGCSSLIDISALANWDVCNVTKMEAVFKECISLSNFTALANWNVRNVVTLERCFGNIYNIKLDGLSHWKTSSLESLENTFSNCRNLTDLTPLINWDVSKVTNIREMFASNTSLTDISPLANWNVSSIENAENTFKNCTALSDISPLANWKLANVSSASIMFFNCPLQNAPLTLIDNITNTTSCALAFGTSTQIRSFTMSKNRASYYTLKQGYEVNYQTYTNGYMPIDIEYIASANKSEDATWQYRFANDDGINSWSSLDALETDWDRVEGKEIHICKIVTTDADGIAACESTDGSAQTVRVYTKENGEVKGIEGATAMIDGTGKIVVTVPAAWENSEISVAALTSENTAVIGATVSVEGKGEQTTNKLGIATFAANGCEDTENTAVIRLWGQEAQNTAAQIALKAYEKIDANGNAGYEQTDNVVIARNDDFADAMSATGLAGALNAPILLTETGQLSSDVNSVIEKLGAKNAYIIGGAGAVKADVETSLKNISSIENVERIAGQEYFDTSVKCAEKIKEVESSNNATMTNDVIVAYGQNFQDALSMSSYAYKYHIPILLTTTGQTAGERGLTNGYDTAQNKTGKAEIESILNENSTIYVAGGTGAVSEKSVEGSFKSATVKRLAGENGYDTSNEIAKYFTSNEGGNKLSASDIITASGAQEPKGVDALAGAALAGRSGGVILLANSKDYGVNTAGNEINIRTLKANDAFLQTSKTQVINAYILGGVGVLPNTDTCNIVNLLDSKMKTN